MDTYLIEIVENVLHELTANANSLFVPSNNLECLYNVRCDTNVYLSEAPSAIKGKQIYRLAVSNLIHT